MTRGDRRWLTNPLTAWVARFLVMTAVLAARPAAAQNEVAAAATLFKEAKRLAKEGNFLEACPKFEASYALDEQLGTLMNIADCYDQLGKVATAWARWSDALEWAKRVDDPKRITYVEGRLKESEAKLPRVTIEVENPVPTLAIARGDVDVEEAMWGLAIPVDPGPLEVTVSRGERVLERRPVEARSGEVTVVKIDLSAIDEAHPEAPDPAPVVTVEAPPPKEPPPPEPYDPTHRNVGLIVGAVGLAGVLTAAGLEIGALVKKGQAEAGDACVNKFCSPNGLADAQSAATFAEAGQWVGIGGLVVLAVGATIFFTAPPEDDGGAAARVTPWFDAGGGGVLVGGRF